MSFVFPPKLSAESGIVPEQPDTKVPHEVKCKCSYKERLCAGLYYYGSSVMPKSTGITKLLKILFKRNTKNNDQLVYNAGEHNFDCNDVRYGDDVLLKTAKGNAEETDSLMEQLLKCLSTMNSNYEYMKDVDQNGSFFLKGFIVSQCVSNVRKACAKSAKLLSDAFKINTDNLLELSKDFMLIEGGTGTDSEKAIALRHMHNNAAALVNLQASLQIKIALFVGYGNFILEDFRKNSSLRSRLFQNLSTNNLPYREAFLYGPELMYSAFKNIIKNLKKIYETKNHDGNINENLDQQIRIALEQLNNMKNLSYHSCAQASNAPFSNAILECVIESGSTLGELFYDLGEEDIMFDIIRKEISKESTNNKSISSIQKDAKEISRFIFFRKAAIIHDTGSTDEFIALGSLDARLRENIEDLKIKFSASTKFYRGNNFQSLMQLCILNGTTGIFGYKGLKFQDPSLMAIGDFIYYYLNKNTSEPWLSWAPSISAKISNDDVFAAINLISRSMGLDLSKIDHYAMYIEPFELSMKKLLSTLNELSKMNIGVEKIVSKLKSLHELLMISASSFSLISAGLMFLPEQNLIATIQSKDMDFTVPPIRPEDNPQLKKLVAFMTTSARVLQQQQEQKKQE